MAFSPFAPYWLRIEVLGDDFEVKSRPIDPDDAYALRRSIFGGEALDVDETPEQIQERDRDLREKWAGFCAAHAVEWRDVFLDEGKEDPLALPTDEAG